MTHTHSNTSRTPATAPQHGEVISAGDFAPPPHHSGRRRWRWRPLSLAVVAGLVLLSLVALFLFQARSVSFDAQPASAQIQVDRWLKLKLGDNFLLLPGPARITASAPGYATEQDQVTITNAAEQRFDVPLQKLPGTLLVKGPPSAEAEVWLDGEHRGALNQPLAPVAAGEHQLQVISPRYLPYRDTIDVTGMGQAQTLVVELQPAWADVSVASDPTARFAVDGEPQGETPLVAEVLAGERELSLTQPGYKTWRQLMTIEAGQTIELTDIVLEKADGLVEVKSSPAGASITVADQYHGLTPNQIALPPGQRHQITLYKEGYQPARQWLEVNADDNQRIELRLEPLLGEVHIAAEPADALVYVDGKLMGRANQTLRLPAAQTTVTLKKSGYGEFSTQVIPRPGVTQRVEATLKTLEELKWLDIPEQMTSPAGQTLKLFKPDHQFTMGSSRREQGRRANENQRPVALTRAFYLGRHEVTNAQYRQFDPEHSSNHVKGNSLDGERQPVVNISWQEAALYCNWLSEQAELPPFYQITDGIVSGFNPQATGYRLASEAEWAWAARWQDGAMRKYGWGEQLPPPAKAANIADRAAAAVAGYIQADYQDGYAVSAPVGSFAANRKGLFDLDGNVAEWLHDVYQLASGLSGSAERDPLGPTEGDYHVIRGPSWAHGGVTELRLSFRDYGDAARNDVGFRIARFVE